jgi:hypothetical protein
MNMAIVLGSAIAAGAASLVLSDDGRWALALCLLGANYAYTIIKTLR